MFQCILIRLSDSFFRLIQDTTEAFHHEEEQSNTDEQMNYN